jgi:hypothetical protein
MLVRVAERGCSRLADDVRATTGHELAACVQTADDNWTEVEVDLDGKPLGSVSRYFPEDPEEFIAEVADALQEAFLDEEFWGGWPTCPNHGTHHLTAGVDADGIATWFCRNGGPIARIGSLPDRT